ncbi:MAG: hypothetical protein AAF458_04890 [Pseudomonadota bacterium]
MKTGENQHTDDIGPVQHLHRRIVVLTHPVSAVSEAMILEPVSGAVLRRLGADRLIRLPWVALN